MQPARPRHLNEPCGDWRSGRPSLTQRKSTNKTRPAFRMPIVPGMRIGVEKICVPETNPVANRYDSDHPPRPRILQLWSRNAARSPGKFRVKVRSWYIREIARNGSLGRKPRGLRMKGSVVVPVNLRHEKRRSTLFWFFFGRPRGDRPTSSETGVPAISLPARRSSTSG